MLVRYGAHDAAHGQAVEVVVHEDEHTERDGGQLRADAGLDVLCRPAPEGRGAARAVHERDHRAEDDEEDEDADVVAVGLGQHGDDAVVEDVQHRALKGKVRVQQAAGEDADEEGGVDLLRDEREDDGYDGRQQRPGRAVKAAYGLLRLAAVREHAHDERADDERQDGDERRQGADFFSLVHFFSHSFCFITAGYPQTASACGYRYRFSFP